MFYLLSGLIGYAAFGSNAPGNFLAEFGSFKPSWIVDFANICLTVHLFGAYQVLEIFGFLVLTFFQYRLCVIYILKQLSGHNVIFQVVLLIIFKI